MQAFAWIVVLIERGAVEAHEAMCVVGEMARHPVDDDAKTCRMAGVDEAREPLRFAMARRRRERRERLIAPRAAERMFGDRQQLDMREAERRSVGRQAARGFLPVELGAVFVQPGAEMHLVDRDRRIGRLLSRTRLHPVGVAPVVIERGRDDRGGFGRRLAAQRHRICLERQFVTAAVDDREFIALAGADARDEQFPDPAPMAQPHGMTTAVPAVEIADDRDSTGVGRPHGKADARRIADPHFARAEQVGEFRVAAGREKGEVLLGQKLPEGIGIFGNEGGARPDRTQEIWSVARHESAEEPALVQKVERRYGVSLGRIERLDAERAGRKSAHDAPVRRLMGAQQREGIGAARLRESIDDAGVERGGMGPRAFDRLPVDRRGRHDCAAHAGRANQTRPSAQTTAVHHATSAGARTLIERGVAPRGIRPGEGARHGGAAHLIEAAAGAERVERAAHGALELLGGRRVKQEAGAAVLDRIGEAAGAMSDRQRAEALGVHLAEAAGLETLGHEQEVAAREHGARLRPVEADAYADLRRVLAR